MNGAYCRHCGYRRDVHDQYAQGDHRFEPCSPKPATFKDVGNGVIVWRRDEVKTATDQKGENEVEIL